MNSLQEGYDYYGDDWGGGWSGAMDSFYSSLKTVEPIKTDKEIDKEKDWTKPKITVKRKADIKEDKTDIANKFGILGEDEDNEDQWPPVSINRVQGGQSNGNINTAKKWKDKINYAAADKGIGKDIMKKERRNFDEMMSHSSCPKRRCCGDPADHCTKDRATKKDAAKMERRVRSYQDFNDKANKQKETLNPIKTIEPEGIHRITEDGMWEEIELAVDSGATESVAPPTLPETIPTVEGPASKRGVMYEVASGHQIPNEGEKRFQAVTEEGSDKKMVLQVCDVNQGLLSVIKMIKSGNRVVFDESGSYVESKTSGDRTWIRERGGMFIMKLWVKRPF